MVFISFANSYVKSSDRGDHFMQNAKFSTTRTPFCVLRKVKVEINIWEKRWAVQQDEHTAKCIETPCRLPSSNAAGSPSSLGFLKASTASLAGLGSFPLGVMCESPPCTHQSLQQSDWEGPAKGEHQFILFCMQEFCLVAPVLCRQPVTCILGWQKPGEVCWGHRSCADLHSWV